jgi:FKBP-type peptidyl-prolyl cis-trans isomerase FklB
LKTRISALMIVAVVVVAGFAIGAKEATIQKKVTKPMKLETEMQKVSYIIGTNLGNQFKQSGLENLVYDAFVQGVKDVMESKDLAVSPDYMQKVMMAFGETMKKKQQEMQLKQQAEIAKEAPVNAKEGKDFLAKNAKKSGVKVLPSGLQYKVIKSGTGATPKLTDTVEAVYKGSLIDGSVFDASDRHEGPAIFEVNRVIKGWTEALQIMKVGDKWELYITGDLAYGPNGNGRGIGPNKTLLFEIELVEIKEKK